MALVSCVVSAGAGAGGGAQRLAPFLFRTYSCGFRVRGAVRGTTRAKVWHAVRASAAAPTYFQEFHRDGLVHQVTTCPGRSGPVWSIASFCCLIQVTLGEILNFRLA